MISNIILLFYSFLDILDNRNTCLGDRNCIKIRREINYGFYRLIITDDPPKYSFYNNNCGFPRTDHAFST